MRDVLEQMDYLYKGAQGLRESWEEIQGRMNHTVFGCAHALD